MAHSGNSIEEGAHRDLQTELVLQGLEVVRSCGVFRLAAPDGFQFVRADKGIGIPGERLRAFATAPLQLFRLDPPIELLGGYRAGEKEGG